MFGHFTKPLCKFWSCFCCQGKQGHFPSSLCFWKVALWWDRSCVISRSVKCLTCPRKGNKMFHKHQGLGSSSHMSRHSLSTGDLLYILFSSSFTCIAEQYFFRCQSDFHSPILWDFARLEQLSYSHSLSKPGTFCPFGLRGMSVAGVSVCSPPRFSDLLAAVLATVIRKVDLNCSWWELNSCFPVISPLFYTICLTSAPCIVFVLVFAGVETVGPSPAWKLFQDCIFHDCGWGLGTFLLAETKMFPIQHVNQVLDAFIANLECLRLLCLECLHAFKLIGRWI